MKIKVLGAIRCNHHALWPRRWVLTYFEHSIKIGLLQHACGRMIHDLFDRCEQKKWKSLPDRKLSIWQFPDINSEASISCPFISLRLHRAWAFVTCWSENSKWREVKRNAQEQMLWKEYSNLQMRSKRHSIRHSTSSTSFTISTLMLEALNSNWYPHRKQNHKKTLEAPKHGNRRVEPGHMHWIAVVWGWSGDALEFALFRCEIFVSFFFRCTTGQLLPAFTFGQKTSPSNVWHPHLAVVERLYLTGL